MLCILRSDLHVGAPLLGGEDYAGRIELGVRHASDLHVQLAYVSSGQELENLASEPDEPFEIDTFQSDDIEEDTNRIVSKFERVLGRIFE